MSTKAFKAILQRTWIIPVLAATLFAVCQLVPQQVQMRAIQIVASAVWGS